MDVKQKLTLSVVLGIMVSVFPSCKGCSHENREDSQLKPFLKKYLIFFKK
jgi:hypothetical protein